MPTRYPPLFQQAASLARFLVRWLRHGRRIVAREERERRLAICRGCPWWSGPDARCLLCGCYLRLKTWLANGKTGRCPDDPPRWWGRDAVTLTDESARIVLAYLVAAHLVLGAGLILRSIFYRPR